jgi:DNA/RNA-binding domain of Phe-tRNA-synthetase-like protein
VDQCVGSTAEVKSPADEGEAFVNLNQSSGVEAAALRVVVDDHERFRHIRSRVAVAGRSTDVTASSDSVLVVAWNEHAAHRRRWSL